MLSSSSEKKTVIALPCSHKMYEFPFLLDIIFQYASLYFYSSFPPSFMTSQDMFSYKSFLEEKGERTKNKISAFLEGKKRSETYRCQARIQLATDTEKMKNEHAKKLESDIQNRELQYKQTLKDIDEEESEQKRIIQQDLLSGNNAICELIKLFEEFERLLEEELKNKSCWSRIKINRDPDYDRRVSDGLVLFGVIAVVIIIALICISALCLMPTVSSLIPVVAHAVTSHFFFNFTISAGFIGGLIIAGINGLFKIDMRGNERFSQDSLSSLSPTIVEKFEEIKAVQSTFVNDDPETSLANVSTQSTLRVVCSAFGRNLSFFKQLNVDQTKKEANEDKSAFTPSLNNNNLN